MAKSENNKYVDAAYLTENAGRRIEVSMRLTLKGREKFFGPGVATLMHLISEKGSVQAAANHMNMSYGKARKILKRTEEELGFALFVSRPGGAGGARSELSGEGLSFLKDYDAFCAEVKAFTESAAGKYFKEL